MTNRPSGTVTFLFTDIEGSTKLWEQHHDWMERAHKQQEAIMREAVARHNGYAYKMIGDAFQIAFATARDALDAAVDAQRELHREFGGDNATNQLSNDQTIALRVRMALHAGVTEERGDDYVGPVLNRVARLMSAGHGGQILISDATESLVRDRLPEGVTLRDMGERRLKDLTRAERVYQVVAPDLPSDFPPLKTLDTLPNNLPIQLTSFVGREKEILEIERLLASARLVTLTGAGGCGKTRLSLQVAADLLDEFANGVWFVELAPLADPALVPQSVANALNVQEQAGRSIQAALLDYLREKTLLLVLDNCEHLIDACAKLADELLHACPKIKILASSREALGIAGEVAHRVPSLSLPPKDFRSLADFGSLTQFEAVRLFIDRAVTIEPTFAVTNQNAPAVAQICHRLDGIPLALELAAARVKVLSVEQISKRLDDRFKLLTGGSRTAMPRQQTLRAAIDWSYSLLSEQERVLLRRLSVFAGGWTLEAAEFVCAEEQRSAGAGEKNSPLHPSTSAPLLRDDILDLTTHLVDKSLVIVERQRDEVRYRMMETIRQYARERLLDSDEGEEIRSRHLNYFLEFAEEVEPKLRGPEQFEWLDRLDIEHDNLRAAMEWSLGEGRAENDRSTDSAELNAALAMYFFRRGYYREAKVWSEKTERLTRDAPAATRAEALYALGSALANVGEYAQAETILQQALTLYRNLDNRPRVGGILNTLGVIVTRLGKSDQAEQYWQEALTLRRAIGDKWGITQTLQNFEGIALRKGDYARAIAINEEGLKLSEELGDERMIARRLTGLGHIALAQSDFKQADAMLKRAVSTFWQMKEKFSLFQALVLLAQVIAAQGQPRRAAQILGAIEFGREELGWNLSEKERTDLSQVVSPIRVQLGDGDFAIAFNEGRAMKVEQAIEYAMTNEPN